MNKTILCVAVPVLLALVGCQKTADVDVENTFDISQFSDSNLPLMVVEKGNAEIPDEPKVLVKVKLINSDPANSLEETEDLDYGFDDEHIHAGIERRGFSSQRFAKKQYSLELWQSDEEDLKDYPLGTGEDELDGDDAVDDQSESLLAMPEEEDWILHAPYSDKTLMRNHIAYGLAADISGLWHPRSAFLELFFKTGERMDYRGVYLLTEKIKRDDERLDINKLKEDEISGDDLTGGYILELTAAERVKDDEKSIVVDGKTLVVAYPKAKNLQLEQQQYIEGYLQDFVDALYGDTPDDPANGYATLADLDALVDYLLINELFKNLDAFSFSTYFHKDKEGLLIAGPVWDFNFSSGNNATANSSSQSHSSAGWMYQQRWIAEKLYQSPQFVAAFKSRWLDLRGGLLSDTAIESRIDGAFDELDQGAAQRNFQKWAVLGRYIQGNQIPDSQSHRQEVEYFRQWIMQRLQWIDANIHSL